VNRVAPLIYVLPVEPRGEARYGDPRGLLAEAQAAERLGAMFAFPEFDETPWFADHLQGRVRQETDLIERIMPEIEARLKMAVAPQQRLLVGFSKSGWGALSLLLRHPDRFGAAAAWDAPFLTTRLGRWDTDAVFGDQATLEQHSLAHLSRTAGDPFRSRCRIIIGGHCLFREDIAYAHQIFTEQSIPHRFRNDLVYPHAWDLRWLWPLLTELLEITRARSESQP